MRPEHEPGLDQTRRLGWQRERRARQADRRPDDEHDAWLVEVPPVCVVSRTGAETPLMPVGYWIGFCSPEHEPVTFSNEVVEIQELAPSS